MPTFTRCKTKYQGIYYIEAKAIGSNKTEKVFYLRYRRDGKLVEEKAGRQSQDDMTAAKAAQIRARRIAGDELPNRKKREVQKAEKLKQANKWTIDRLFEAYMKSRRDNKAKSVDDKRYEKHLKAPLGSKEPKELAPLDVDRIRIKLSKELSPQTVKHVLNLLTWIINFGVKKNLCEGINFHIQKPTVNNLRTEDLTDEQLKALLKAIDNDSNIQIKNLMKLALYTGMRRGELFKLQWKHINFERGFIDIVDPKGIIDQKIPLNQAARDILENHERPKFKVKGKKKKFFYSPYVFPGEGGRQRVSAQAGVNKIKTAAELPEDFRPLHGLRHVYASMLASSGEVDLYTLQRLLTHKDPRMTQRYAHLRDEALKRASDVAVDIIDQATANTDDEDKKDKVSNLEKHK